MIGHIEKTLNAVENSTEGIKFKKAQTSDLQKMNIYLGFANSSL